MGGTRLASDGTPDAKIISDAVRELQESIEKLEKDNAKATKFYLKITVITAIGCTILGVVLGTYL